MSNFNDPEHKDEAFKAAQRRFRITGAEGTLLETDKHGKEEPVDPDKAFRDARSEMRKDKKNIVTYGKQGDTNKDRRSTHVRAISLKVDQTIKESTDE